MKVNGKVKLLVTANVYDLETDSVYMHEDGKVAIVDDEEFFADWCEAWRNGYGNLISVKSLRETLKAEGT